MGKRLKRQTRGDRNIAWVEQHCRIPEGKDVGKPVVLRPWQLSDIRKIYNNAHGTRTAIISFAKKNARSTHRRGTRVTSALGTDQCHRSTTTR